MSRVRKLTPVSIYDVRGLESWLEDMARRGFLLKKLRPAFSTFIKKPSQTVRYRAEPFRSVLDDGPPQAMLDLYQDFGWEFVCQAGREFLIFSTLDPNAPEPHSDPEIQARMWKKLYRSKRRTLLFILALSLIVLICAPVSLFHDGTPILELLTSSAPFLLAYLLFLPFVICQTWSGMQRIALIVQQLEGGVPLEHWSVYPRRRWSELISIIIAAGLLTGIIIVQNILPFTSGRAQPLTNLDAFTPLSLTELEGKNYMSNSFKADGIDYANFCAVYHYLLCPDRWKAVQSGSIRPDDWTRMEIWWYDLPGWLSGLSAPLARELLDDAALLKRDIWWTDNIGGTWTVEYIPYEGVSFLAVARHSSGSFQIAAAAAGDKAVLVQYTGRSSLSGCLDGIVNMVR